MTELWKWLGDNGDQLSSISLIIGGVIAFGVVARSALTLWKTQGAKRSKSHFSELRSVPVPRIVDAAAQEDFGNFEIPGGDTGMMTNRYETDFPDHIRLGFDLATIVDDKPVTIRGAINIDMRNHCRLASYLLPECDVPTTAALVRTLSFMENDVLDSAKTPRLGLPWTADNGTGMRIKNNDGTAEIELSAVEGGRISASLFPYSPVVYVYGEQDIPEAELVDLRALYMSRKRQLRYRGPSFAKSTKANARPTKPILIGSHTEEQ